MSIVILNWAGGENDPFTFANRMYKNAFEELGRSVCLLNLEDPFFLESLKEQKADIEFVLTWQGLGSGHKSAPEHFTSIWDDLRIPLLCYHADHPSLRPDHHDATSPWIRHVYFAQSFAQFANAYLTRQEQAMYLELPSVYPKLAVQNFVGDYFVLPKNLNDNVNIYQAWSSASQKHLVDFLGEADTHITRAFLLGNQTNLHEVIDALLTADALAYIRQDFGDESEATVHLVIHHLLHQIYRNFVSEFVISELAEIPIKIYGRGWDRFKAKNNPKHQYLPGASFDSSAFLYWSNYGILDVAPVNDCLHDRTLRAMSYDSGYLIGSNWAQKNLLPQDFSSIFFDGTEGDLRSKAEQIVRAPTAHRERCREFANYHRAQFTIATFLEQLDGLASSIRQNYRSI